MNGLHTDLYQLTMSAGFFQAGKVQERATFELFIRRLPWNRNFIVAAGLQQAVDFLLNFSFTKDEVDYLRGLPQFARAPREFFDSLLSLRFTGDMSAVPEGTPLFGGEPLLRVSAPLLEAQIPETFLLATTGFQSLIATKAARVADAAGGRAVVEFGTRRAHSPEAGMYAGRAAYIGGCVGTSNVEAGFRYGVPVFGTAAHSWVQSFQSEMESFRELQKLLGEATVYLIDTYDTLEGARLVGKLGKPVWGVRLDSGNLVELSRQVRVLLDEAGLKDAKIMATGDLNEYKILEIMAAHAPIDVFGVGTELATSADAPSLGAIYKIVELESGGVKRYTAKFSTDKHTMPGTKQVFRHPDHDLIAGAWEPAASGGHGLLKPVIAHGKLVAPLPTAKQARDYAAQAIGQLPKAVRSLFPMEEPYPVQYSKELQDLLRRARKHHAGVTA